MGRRPLTHHIIAVHAAPEALAPMTRVILAKLGYVILTPEELASLGPEVERRGPELRIVDERNLAEVPEDPIPIVVLSGRHGVTGADTRIVGAVRRPAGMHELYRLIHQVLEEAPRTVPRVPTHLVAHCRRDRLEWRGVLLSLSENGGLLRSVEPLPLGSRFTLRFELPRSGSIEVEAETAYQLLPDLGVVFNATSPADREAISAFVGEMLGSA